MGSSAESPSATPKPLELPVPRGAQGHHRAQRSSRPIPGLFPALCCPQTPGFPMLKDLPGRPCSRDTELCQRVTAKRGLAWNCCVFSLIRVREGSSPLRCHPYSNQQPLPVKQVTHQTPLHSYQGRCLGLRALTSVLTFQEGKKNSEKPQGNSSNLGGKVQPWVSSPPSILLPSSPPNPSNSAGLKHLEGFPCCCFPHSLCQVPFCREFIPGSLGGRMFLSPATSSIAQGRGPAQLCGEIPRAEGIPGDQRTSLL